MKPGTARLLTGGALVAGLLLAAFAAPGVEGRRSGEATWDQPRLPPSRTHPFGTDQLGRDVAALVSDGARTSLAVAVAAVAVATIVGGVIGGAAGIGGGLVGAALMRFTDIVAALPQVMLVIVIAALWGRGSATLVILTIALTTWMGTARLTRAEALRVGASDFVLAARATGAGSWRVALRHYLPHLLPVLLVAATLRIGNAILLETSLGFLGLGLPAATPTWGRTVWEGLAGLRESWWISVAAGSAITVATVGFNLLGDGLRDLVSGSAR